MASQAYYDWKADGSPKKFSRPISAVANKLRAHGYTVYQEGNLAHLQHEPPEDHTFFSQTGWPGKTPYPYCNATDIMPPAVGQKSKINGKPLPSLQQLSAQIYADKQAGHPGVAFLKYMNSEPEGNNTGPCWHDTWTPNHARISSSDRGHIHLSGRSDSVTSSLSDDYDLVARITGEDDMSAQDVYDAWKLAADASADRPDPATPFGRQMRDSVNAVIDFATAPMATAITALTGLVTAQSPATAEQIAAALAPLINAQIGDGASPAEVETIIRRVFGTLDAPTA
jgi:hypothetical protein